MLCVTIITLNEEKYLERSLNSVKNLADEIIVVDSGSTDRTLEIAKKFNSKIYTRKFDNYSNQKNFANEKAKGEWILSLDADEVIEKELAKEIKTAITKNEYDAYSIPRKNIILGKFIKYTRWQPELDRHIWLFKKEKSVWRGDVHEEVIVNGKVGKLKHAKIHYQYETVPEFIDMIERYSSFEAKEKLKNGEKFSVIQLLIQPVYNFLVRYFYRLGFLDGWRGLVLSTLMAFYHIQVQSKLFNLQNK